MSSDSPAAILYDANGVALAVSNGVAVPANTKGLLAAGSDGTNARFIRVATDGSVRIDPTGTTAQPVTDNGGSLTVDGAVVASQGTAAALSGYWPVRVTDGSNTMPTADTIARALFSRVTDGVNGAVAVKAGLTSALPSDPSFVVQVSPNQEPIPTTLVPATALGGSAVGRRTNVSSGTFVDVRQTTYTEQTTNAQRSVASTSASDAAAGTGARQVTIYYLDQNGSGPGTGTPFYTEVVTLNGTTPVNTVATNICFIERIDVTSVGSTGSNVGTINLYTTTAGGGTIFGSITTGSIATGVGDNTTLWTHHYVPANYKVRGYIVTAGVIASAGGGSSVTVLRGRVPTSATSPYQVISDILNAAQGNSVTREYSAPIEIMGPYQIVAFATPGSNNSTLTCSFDFSDQPV
jgi:hypothetical protein